MRRRCHRGSAALEAPGLRAYYIETSLGTRMLTAIHSSASVADAKMQIALSHSQTLRGMEEPMIHDLKVQHNGQFYSLDDEMPLEAAFVEELSSNKFLFVEASIPEKEEEVNVLDPIANGLTSSGTDEELRANPENPEPESKETPMSHGTKKRKRAKKVQISSVGEQSKPAEADFTVNTDSQSAASDLLVKVEDGSGGNRKEKKKKKKKDRSSAAVMEEKSYGTEGLVVSQTPLQEVGDKSVDVAVSVVPSEGEEPFQKEVLLPMVGVQEDVENAIETPPDEQPNGDQLGKEQKNGSKSMKKEKKKRKKVVSTAENVIDPEMEQQNHRAEKQDKSMKKEKKKRKKVVSAAESVIDPEMEQRNHSAEKQGKVTIEMNDASEVADDALDKKKRKKVVSTAENVIDPEMEQQNHSAEKQDKPMKKEKKKRKKFVSTAENVIDPEMEQQNLSAEKQGRVTLPSTEGENVVQSKDETEMNDVSEVADDALDKKKQKKVVSTAEIVIDPEMEQQNHSADKQDKSLKKEKKKRKKVVSTAENVIDPEMEQLNHSAEKQGKVTMPSTEGENVVQSKDDIEMEQQNYSAEKQGKVTMPSTEEKNVVPSKDETEMNDVSEVAEDALDKIILPGKFQSEIDSSVNNEGTSQSIKQKEVEDQHTQGSGKSPDAQEANDGKLEQSVDQENVLPLTNEELSKPSQDGSVARTSQDVAGWVTLEKNKKPEPASRTLGNKSGDLKRGSLPAKSKGLTEAAQSAKTKKLQQALNRSSAMSPGKGSSGGRSLLKGLGKASRFSLFSDSESESFSGENMAVDSNASTQPPSSSSSSDDSSSDSESDASQDFNRKGTEGGSKRSGGAGQSVANKKKIPNIEEMSMDEIIKSSKRFKKAKFTASQYQELDSQAS